MKKFHRATLLAAASAALLGAATLLLASCDNSYGSLASIQGEVKQSGTSTFKNAAVTKALRFDGSYWASTSRLFSRAVSNGAWKLRPVKGSSDYSLLSMANDGDAALYASVIGASGDNAAYSFDGAAWTAIAGIPAGSWIDGLWFVNGTLFAQAHAGHASEIASDHTYSLLYFDGSALVPADASLLAKTVPFVGVAWDGAAFWFATESLLYQGDASASGAAADATPAGLSGKTITSLLYSTSDLALYAGTETGYLYRCTGTVASEKPATGPITALVDIGDNTLLAGWGTTTSVSTGGYYEGTFASLVSGEEGAVTLDASHYSTTVSGKAALSFFWDPSGSILFACLAPGATSGGYGLYSTEYSGSVWSGWTAE